MSDTNKKLKFKEQVVSDSEGESDEESFAESLEVPAQAQKSNRYRMMITRSQRRS